MRKIYARTGGLLFRPTRFKLGSIAYPQNRIIFQKNFEKKQKFLKIISFGLLGSFLIILSYFRPFDPIPEQNKFRKAEKNQNFHEKFLVTRWRQSEILMSSYS